MTPSSKRVPRTWCSDKLFELLSASGMEPLLEAGQNYLRRRRLLDFTIAPGLASAKVQDEDSRPHQVSLAIEPLTDQQWDAVFGRLSEEAYFVASLLAGELPIEIEGVFQEAGAEFLPPSIENITFECDANDNSPLCGHLAALWLKLKDRLDSDPFTVFILRGRGRDETLAQLNKLRREVKPGEDFGPTLGYQRVEYESAPPLGETFDYFWSSRDELDELRYNIKADELPAAILKWLDPLPLAAATDEIELALEEAYAKVASRAQAYGMGIRRD